MTVGELKAALADYEDDMPIAAPCSNVRFKGGLWVVGFKEVASRRLNGESVVYPSLMVYDVPWTPKMRESVEGILEAIHESD